MANPVGSSFGKGSSGSQSTDSLVQELIKSGALDNPSLWDQMKSGAATAGAGALGLIFKTLNAPLAAGTALVTGRDPIEAIKQGLTPSQIVNPNPQGFAQEAGNLALDVLADPLTYFGMKMAEPFLRTTIGGEERALSEYGANELKRLGEEEFAKRLARDASFEIAVSPVKGLGFGAPFSEKGSVLLPQEDLLKGVSSVLQTADRTPVVGKAVEGTFNALNKVFGADTANNEALFNALRREPDQIATVLRDTQAWKDLQNVQIRETQLRTAQMVEENKKLAQYMQEKGVSSDEIVRLVEERKAYPSPVMEALDAYGEKTRAVNRLENTVSELLNKRQNGVLTEKEAKYLDRLLNSNTSPRVKAIAAQAEADAELTRRIKSMDKTLTPEEIAQYSAPEHQAARYLIDTAKDLMARDAKLGLEYRPMNDYVARMLTPEASDAMFGSATRYTTSGNTSSTIGRFGKHRTQRETRAVAEGQLRVEYMVPPTVEHIYEPNPFISTAVREASTIKAETTRQLYEGVARSPMAMPIDPKIIDRPIYTNAQGVRFRIPDVAYFKERRIALPMPIAENIEKTGAVIGGGPQAKEFVRAYDKINSFFKASNTVFFPAFHAGNFIGGVFNNWLAGTFNPAVYAEAHSLAGKMEILDRIGSLPKAEIVSVDVRRAAANAVVYNRSAGVIEVSEEAVRKAFADKKLLKSLGGEFKNAEELKNFLINRELVREMFGETMAPRSMTDAFLNDMAHTIDRVNPKNQADGIMRELEKFKMKDTTGKTWTGKQIVEEYQKRVGFRSGMRAEIATGLRDQLANPTGLGKAGEALNSFTNQAYSYVEDRIRMPLFLDTIKKTGDPAKAAEKVFTYHFDYSPESMSKVESSTIRRIIPFYTWTRRNIPLQIAEFIKQPGKQMLALRAQQDLISPEVRSQLPDYLQNQLVIQTNADNENPNIISGMRLPIFDLNNFNPEGILSSVTPAIRLPVEMATDRSFFYDKAITDMGTSMGKNYDSFPMSLLKPLVGYGTYKAKDGTTVPFVDPVKAYPLEQFLGRFGRTSSQVNNQFEGSAGSVVPGVPNDTIRVATGLRPETKSLTDLKSMKDQELTDELTKLLKRKGVLGSYQGVYQRKNVQQ